MYGKVSRSFKMVNCKICLGSPRWFIWTNTCYSNGKGLWNTVVCTDCNREREMGIG